MWKHTYLSLCLCCVVFSFRAINGFKLRYLALTRVNFRSALSMLVETTCIADIQMQSFLKGDSNEPWRGSRDVLKRKKQWPQPEYSPQQVIRKVLNALQINDDPQLDHGCCVLLEFKSPNGVLAQSGLDPTGYGRYLRSTDYSLLLDYNDAELIGEPIQGKDSLSLIQRVAVKGWTLNGQREERKFDFFLKFANNTWLIDTMVIVK